MSKQKFPAVAAISLFATMVGTSSAEPAVRIVPQATCGPGERVETVQGQTTLAERFEPGGARPYTCNLELVGQFDGQGAGFDLEVLGNCAYFSTMPTATLERPGTVVLDVSDSSRPRAAAYLTTPATLQPGESLSIDPVRKLLLASKPPATRAEPFDIYDLSTDCRHPVLKRTLVLPGMMSHAGEFSPDGRTYYGTSWDIPPVLAAKGDATLPPLSAVFVIDMTEPSDPKPLATWEPEKWKTHSISVSRDGMRAYLAISWRPLTDVPDPHGLVVLDISDFQLRRANPAVRVVSTLLWDDTHEAQFVLPVTINGSPYLVFTDLTGAVGYRHPAPAGVCRSGKPGYGFPRIIDIRDEKKPRIVSKLMLAVADPANCSKSSHDPTALYGYGSTVCEADSTNNARLLACAFFEGGLRVFDIRDPTQPREVAYYKPPARGQEARPGSMVRTWGSDKLTADPVIVSRFRGNKEIWFLSSDNAFQVVRFSEAFRAANRDLFDD